MKQMYRVFLFVGLLCLTWLSCSQPPISTEQPAAEVSSEVSTERTVEVSQETPSNSKETPVDASSEDGVEAEPSPEVSLETEPESQNGEPEAPPKPTPVECKKDEACNALLTKDGLCPGSCIQQQMTTQCRGTVTHGLCMHRFTPQKNVSKLIDGLMFSPSQIPALVREGDKLNLTIEVTNTLSTAKQMPVNYEVSSNWKLVQASFKDKVAIDFKPNETKKLTLTVEALKADVLSNYRSVGSILSFAFFRDAFSLFAAIGYGPGKDRAACGTHYFPKSYCPNSPCSKSRRHYYQAACCKGVWYPGAACCEDSDCTNGRTCFDGKCLTQKPRALGNTLAQGHQRVLIVLSDRLDFPSDPSKLCTNRVKDLRSTLKLDEFEAYFNDISQAFLKRPAPKFQYVILAGINTKDFNPDGGRDLRSMHNALEEHLVKKGCIKSANEFDKRVIYSGMLSIGPFTGRAMNGGLVGMKKNDMYLFAHELLHTYGASDLYLDLGGSLHYLIDLMGNNLGQYGTPGMGVAWGEILWGDANRNGVIDTFEFAVYPDSLVATGLTARLASKGSLEISANVKAMEQGVEKRIMLHRIEVELPEYKAKVTMALGGTYALTPPQVDLDAIRNKGSVKLRVNASYWFTDRSFKRIERKLSFEKDVKLSP